MFRTLGILLLLTGCERFYGERRVLAPAFPHEPRTLDWYLAEDPASHFILQQTQRGLTWLDANGKVIAALADGWSTDASRTQYAFTLSPSAKWSDGVPVTAEHFAYGWNRWLQGDRKRAPQGLALVETVVAHGPGQLKVTLQQPDPDFLKTLADPRLGPQRPDVASAFPTAFADPLHLRSTGPYQVLEWKPGSHLWLVANSYFYGGKPALDKVQLVFATVPLNAFGNPDYASTLWKLKP